MKNKIKFWRYLLIGTILAIFIVPIPSEVYKDGGSQEYTALTYKVVHWNRLVEDAITHKTSIYFFPDNFKSIDELWQEELDK